MVVAGEVDLMERAVFLEKSWVGAAGAVGVLHYAVKVGDDWYELGANKSSKASGKTNVINGDLDGYPRSDRERKTTMNSTLTLAGATQKTTGEIINFNQKWVGEKTKYEFLIDNCQKYALDLIQYLVGASFKMGIPMSTVNAWADGPGCHAVSKDHYHQARATVGKAGAQLVFFAAEVEGPMAGAEASGSYVGVEASLGRAEGQIGPVGVRLEPNVNCSFGVHDGQAKFKLAGFGVTIGKGFAIHTPLLAIGIGRF